jgi:O-antigen ligase
MNPGRLLAWTSALYLSSTLFTHSVALRLLLLFFGAAVAATWAFQQRAHLTVVPPLWQAVALWAAWVAVSLAWSEEPARSLKEFRNEIGYSALTLWVCFLSGQAANAASIALRVVGSVALVACGIAFYYFFLRFYGYQEGLHGGSGNFSSALLTLVPCVLLGTWVAVRTRERSSVRLALGGLLAVLLLAAYTTLNRTIWIGFAVQLLLVGALLALRRRERASLRARLVAGAAAALVVAAGAGMLVHVQAERSAFGARDFSNDPRLALWSQTVEQIRERPLTGYGFGRGILRETLQGEFDDPTLWHAHNLLLDTAIQVGLPGLALLLLLLAALAHAGWRLARRADDVAAACGIALIAVVAGMLVRNMTDILWLRGNALFFWGIAGILLGYAGQPRARLPG